MRCAILSDIHSNLAAFQAVLQDLDRGGGADLIWCLGDIVGYGPDPQECIRLLREYDHVCVAGNHDWGALEKIDLGDFNSEAAAACRWTGHQLGPDEREYLENLSLTESAEGFTLAHGSPREPIWEYLLSTHSALINFSHFDTAFCLVGHSHVPLVFEQSEDGGDCLYYELADDERLPLGESRLIVNPGSVGQPRDGDPRASYAVYDSEQGAVLHHRVPYAVTATQQRMAEFELPPRLISRLTHGW
jgi:predicted phosphodiesterase